MPKPKNPWEIGPTELIEFALERMHGGSDFDRRLSFLILDVGVETLIKTFLTIPIKVSGVQTSLTKRREAVGGSFHALIEGLQEAIPARAEKLDLVHVQYYHGIRNTLYHQGNTVVAVNEDQLKGYAQLAVDILKELLGIDLTPMLIPPEPEVHAIDDPVQESVELEISSGRYRLERLKSQTIRVIQLGTGEQIKPVKPFLREIIEEKSLPVNLLNKAGNEKNMRQLGSDVIKALMPSAWHGWVAGQKIQRDTLVAVLTRRIREGKVDTKNWALVDTISGLEHETLVFQPTGRGHGNSPFNLNCWQTESGETIV